MKRPYQCRARWSILPEIAVLRIDSPLSAVTISTTEARRGNRLKLAEGTRPRESKGGVSSRLPETRTDYQDPSYLYQVIEAIGAGPDLAGILRRIVSLVTEATRCHACFIYFIRDGQLTLRAASRIYAHLEGKVSFPVGSGLTGWVAKTRQSAVIRDRALEDARVIYVPELEEEQFQSLVSVPMFARNGELIGVI